RALLLGPRALRSGRVCREGAEDAPQRRIAAPQHRPDQRGALTRLERVDAALDELDERRPRHPLEGEDGRAERGLHEAGAPPEARGGSSDDRREQLVGARGEARDVRARPLEAGARRLAIEGGREDVPQRRERSFVVWGVRRGHIRKILKVIFNIKSESFSGVFSRRAVHSPHRARRMAQGKRMDQPSRKTSADDCGVRAATPMHGRDRGVRGVVVLPAVMLVVEIVAGYVTGSMALLADGWHMATHVLALGLTSAGYAVA